MKRFVLVFFCLISAAIAGPEAWLEAGLLTPEAVASVKSELGLSPEQEAKMNTLVQEGAAVAAPVEKQVRACEKELTRVLRQPETSADEAEAALKALLEAEAKVKQMRLRTLLALRDVLTPGQLAKAVKLVPTRQTKKGALDAGIKEKAARLKAAVDSLGVPPTRAMQERGDAVVALVRQGDFTAANEALDQLLADSGVDEKGEPEIPDFSQYSPGGIELEVLKQRYTAVESSAQNVVSIPLVRRLVAGKRALEAAKEAEDAELVGRILTWAEELLRK